MVSGGLEVIGGGVGDWGALASGTVASGGVSRDGDGDGGVGCDVVAHDAIKRLVATTTPLRQNRVVGLKPLTRFIKGYPMFWIFLELALGLALFVLLVWWTLPKKDEDDRPES